MDGMAGWKSVIRFSRKRHAMQMAADRQAVRALLVEDRFEQMRQQRSGDRCEQDMITVGAVLRAATATVQPPRRGERADDMFVGAPGQYLSRAVRPADRCDPKSTLRCRCRPGSALSETTPSSVVPPFKNESPADPVRGIVCGAQVRRCGGGNADAGQMPSAPDRSCGSKIGSPERNSAPKRSPK